MCPLRSDTQGGPYTPAPRCAAVPFGGRVPSMSIAGDLRPVQAEQLYGWQVGTGQKKRPPAAAFCVLGNSRLATGIEIFAPLPIFKAII